MKVVSIDDVPVEERQHVREGVFRIQTLLTGDPDSPGNFALMLSALPDTYESPRHRHNFDQFRYQLKGSFDFASDGKMKPGSIAYFPEGTHYGPQSSNEPNLTLVLQFGGASRSGYMSMEQYEKGMQELSEKGSFAKGVYTYYKEDGTKVNQDAFEAVWEQVNGRRLEYPKQRYQRPVFMEPENFSWVGIGDGIERKLLGVFSELGTRACMYRLQTGAAMQLEDNSLYFIEEGSGRTDGHGYTRHTSIQTLIGEEPRLEAETQSRLLQLGLPKFD